MPITNKNKEEIKKQIITISDGIVLKNKNIKFNKLKLNLIVNDYEKIRDSIKAFMKKEYATRIDRHKVATIMSISILKNNPIQPVNGQEVTYAQRVANIVLTFLLSQVIIEDFYFQENKKEIKLETPDGYINEYIKLIGNNIRNLESVWVNSKQDLCNMIFFISHIFYFIEEYSINKSKLLEKPKE